MSHLSIKSTLLSEKWHHNPQIYPDLKSKMIPDDLSSDPYLISELKTTKKTHFIIPSSVLVIGNFDGIHKGHQHVLSTAYEIAKSKKLPLAVAVFNPHPKRFFFPELAPFRLMSVRLMKKVLSLLSVTVLYEIKFNKTLSEMSDADFIHKVVMDKLKPGWVVVGEDFRFGKNQCGDIHSLEKLSKQNGFELKTVRTVNQDQQKLNNNTVISQKQKYASTYIRESLKQGDCQKAAQSLGHYWLMDGLVEKGEQRGRVLGFPTANIRLKDYLEPRLGTYIVSARIESEPVWRPAIANIGKRPTLNGKDVFLEVHILNTTKTLYNQYLEIALFEFIREEKRFSSLETLKQQIQKDVEYAKTFHSHHLNQHKGLLIPYRD